MLVDAYIYKLLRFNESGKLFLLKVKRKLKERSSLVSQAVPLKCEKFVLNANLEKFSIFN